jgi:hypothetical protein
MTFVYPATNHISVWLFPCSCLLIHQNCVATIMFSDPGMGCVTMCLCSYLQNPAAVQATPSPMTKLQSGHAATMLQQLIAEADNKAVVFSDDLSVQTREQHLQGLAACQEDNIQHKNWLSKRQMIETRVQRFTTYTSLFFPVSAILNMLKISIINN